MSKSTRLHDQFGQRLKELRTKHDLTQLELAVEVEMTPEFIGRIERGESAPSFQTLELLADALDIEVHELFDF